MPGLIALGAAVVGGLIARAVSGPSKEQPKAQQSDFSQQSYVLTPVNVRAQEGAAPANASQDVGRFTV